MELVFATHNQNKLKEVQLLLPPNITLLSLEDIGCLTEIPETGNTLEENARLKADFVTKTYNYPCFADDTGLLVEALDGAPGVFSARYAGNQKNADDNMNRLLHELNNEYNRTAKFKTIIVLNLKNESHIFEGIIEGEITAEKYGEGGFGYDPIFKPKGFKETFAQIPLHVKNKIGHRGMAMQQLINFLKNNTFKK